LANFSWNRKGLSVAHILIFDSGVGGLSILQAIQSHPEIVVADNSWIFCSDNAFFPYGTKDTTQLIDRVRHVLTTLNHLYKPDIIVLACNTASTVALEAVRNDINVPIVGVVPAIKTAGQLSQSRSIGLLATPGTIARPYTQQLIESFASDCHITRVGSSELVEMIEAFLRVQILDQAQLRKILAPFRLAQQTHHLDTIVLACTHFPLIIDALKQQLPEIDFWVDSGEAIANRVVWLLEQISPVQQSAAKESIALFTRKEDSLPTLADVLAKLAINRIDYLNVS
jgi:glutamate racemase